MTTLQLPFAPAPLVRRKPIAEPRVSVVVVNYRQWRDTNTLVQSLCTTPTVRSGEIEVVVVDNHSPTHLVMHRMRRRPGVSLRRWGRNHGFARAVNEGCRLSRGDWVLLLNPDVRVKPSFLRRVLNLAKTIPDVAPRAGIVGFGLQNEDGSRQGSTGTLPTFWSTLRGMLSPRDRRKYSVPGMNREETEWVTGCCMLIRQECLRDLGGLSDDYFLYYEDVDFCRRAREAGWQVLYEPNLQAVHLNPLHKRTVTPRLRMATRHALLTYAKRYWSGWQFRILAGWVRLETRIRRNYASWRGEPGAAKVFRELEKMTAEMVRGHDKKARRRLSRVMNPNQSKR